MKPTNGRSISLHLAILGLVVGGLAMPMNLRATDKSGTIVGETWTKAESPYHITSDILVVSLTIQPGVSIYFDDNYVFEVAGVLKAVGSELEPILFTQTNALVGWQGIFFNYSSPGSDLAYCTIERSVNSAIRAVSSDPTIRHCLIANNAGVNGGGISFVASSSVVSDCLIRSNSASGDAGGIYMASLSSCKFQNCTVSKNSGGQQGGGFAVWNSSVILTNCVISTNTAFRNGGGIMIDALSTTNVSVVQDSIIIGNTSQEDGGGIRVKTSKDFEINRSSIIYNQSFANGGGIAAFVSPGYFHLESSTVAMNAATRQAWNENSYGGGIYVQGNFVAAKNLKLVGNICNPVYGSGNGGGGFLTDGAWTLQNCTVSSNQAIGYNSTAGGGLFCANGSLSVSNTIVSDNFAFTPRIGQPGEGGGIWAGGASTIVNSTIVYNSSEGIRGFNTMSVLNSILFFNNGGGTQISGGPSVTFSDIQNGYVGDGNINRNPIFISRTNFQMLSASLCIDAGHTNSIYNDTCFPPSQGTQRNDIGAYGGPGACDWIAGETPVILGNPQSQKSCIGKETAFSVRAIGLPPLNYQWVFNGTNTLVGQTGTNLALTDIQKNQSGFYSCVVSNILGVVESQQAALIVNDACVDIHMYAGLSIGGKTGNTYVVSYTKNVSQISTWTALATNTLTTNFWLYVDTESAWDTMRFYRVDLQP